MDVFINSAEAISPQQTFNTNELLSDLTLLEKDYFSCITPDYKQYIAAKKLRRMSKIVRMGVATAIEALQKADVEMPDAIIVGTGLGCLDDTIKFLDQIIENKEELLNPTPFIQSTHNTISGQIALLLACKNYNFTFTQQSVSFETALIDAYLSLQEQKESNILIGGIDEITEKTNDLLKKGHCLKDDPQTILHSNTKGYVAGEGSSFFVVTNKASDKNIAKLSAISVFNKMDNDAILPGNLADIFTENNISISDIDVLISGINGDVHTDQHYKPIQAVFSESAQLAYKHLVGEFDTASGFATWLGTRIIQNQSIPHATQINDINKGAIKTVLIHHYNKAHEHSFILLSKC